MYETKKRVSEAKLRAAHMIEKKENGQSDACPHCA